MLTHRGYWTPCHIYGYIVKSGDLIILSVNRLDAVMILRLAIATCSILFCVSVQAVDIYRWVDEKGQVHFSDSPPEKYKKAARKIDSRQYELSEAEKKDLATRAQNSSASIIGQKKEEPKTTSTGTPLTPALGQDTQNDCAALFKAYYESQICFAPYKNANGTMKPGAFEHCKQVEDPTPKCGPIKTSPLSPY